MNREERMAQFMNDVAEGISRGLMIGAMILAFILVMAHCKPMEVQAAQWQSLGKWKTTGYCNCPKCSGKWAYGPTASGKMPEEGRTVAVGGLPFGTRLLIDGRIYLVEDRGVHGEHVDMYYSDHRTAHAHGVQYKEVYIWK